MVGHDVDAVDAAIKQAKQSDKPTLICCKTVIGEGAPTKAGSHDSHGAPLGDKEIAATARSDRLEVGAVRDPAGSLRGVGREGSRRARTNPNGTRRSPPTQRQVPAGSRRIQAPHDAKQLPADWAEKAQAIIAGANERAETVATRKASQQAIEGLSAALPELLGGSADLTGSNLTNWKAAKPVRVNAERQGSRQLRQLRRARIRHERRDQRHRAAWRLQAFGGTFLTFSDYSRNALRVAALMKAPSIFVFTHDSIGLGEDGPTHQSIEHVVEPASDSESAVVAPGRYGRNRGGLDPRGRASWPVVPDLQPSEPAVLGAHGRADRQHREGRLRAARLERRNRRAQDHPDRHRLGSRTGA